MASRTFRVTSFLFLFWFLHIAVAASSTTTTDSQWRVDTAWIGYTSTLGSWSPLWCNSGYTVIGTTFVGSSLTVSAGCGTTDWTAWPTANFWMNCIGSTAIHGNNEDISCDELILLDIYPTSTYSQLSGTCNSWVIYEKSGDQIPVLNGVECMKDTGYTYYRELPTRESTTSSSETTSSTTLTIFAAPKTVTQTIQPSKTGFTTQSIVATQSPTPSPMDPQSSNKRLALGLGLGLGIPFLALICFFCMSYQKLSIIIKIRAPEPPPQYSALTVATFVDLGINEHETHAASFGKKDKWFIKGVFGHK